jgi:hypothetical protein
LDEINIAKEIYIMFIINFDQTWDHRPDQRCDYLFGEFLVKIIANTYNEDKCDPRPKNLHL